MEDDWDVAQRIFILSGVPKGMGVSIENGKECFGVTLAGFRVARSFQENGVLILVRVQIETNYPGPCADTPHPIVIRSQPWQARFQSSHHSGHV